MSDHTARLTRELLALCAAEPEKHGDRALGAYMAGRLQQMLAEAWEVGYIAGDDDLKFPHARVPPVNPFVEGGDPGCVLGVEGATCTRTEPEHRRRWHT